MSFFSELKRRNVFRVGIAYAVAAWVLLQIVDLVLDNIAAPDWVMQVFMLALGIGFPIAIIMAWAFEMTPDGIKLENQVDRSESITPQTGQSLNRIIIGSLVLAVIFLIIDPFENSKLTTATEISPASPALQTTTAEPAELDKSVAVLPFANRSTDPSDAFFAEGMHDDLLTQLAKIGSIKVISRTSVLAFKDTKLKIPEIADELGVATIVEGGIQRSGSRIRVNAQLISAHTDEHLWAETYDRELTAENLFDIQAEIARAIARALKATLSDEEEANIDRVLTDNLQAWQSYQRAVTIRQSPTAVGLKAGLSEIGVALRLDPGFAAAWSLKAILLLQTYWFSDTNPATRDAALEAIQMGRSLDPKLPELDIAEGYYHYWGFRNYPEALKFMQAGLSALPNSAAAHLGTAYVLRRIGRWEEALARLREAIELDPLNFNAAGELGATLVYLHRFGEAKEVFENVADVAARDPTVLWTFALSEFLRSGDVANFIHVLHLRPSSNPEFQMDTFESYLMAKNWQAALEKIDNWPSDYLESKSFHVSKQMLNGLTWRYSGDLEKAEPLLTASKLEFETLLDEQENSYVILQALCLINGGLRDIPATKLSCTAALNAAPSDAFSIRDFEFDAATGLALAGDSEGSIELLNSILSSGTGPTVYPIMYHPAFDGIRQNPAYMELIDKHTPENQQP